MNVLIGKIGRSIDFNEANWSMFSGDEEAPVLYDLLARRYPKHKFYLIGRSDAKRCKEMMPKNIIDLIGDCPSDQWGNVHRGKEYSTSHFWLEEKIKKLGLKFDVGIIYLGPSSTTSIPGVGTKLIGSDREGKQMLMLQNYGAPILHTLNWTGTPYFVLCGDPRYIPWRARDVYNDERFILSQINISCKVPRINAYGAMDVRRHVEHFEYAGIETIFLLREKKVDFRHMSKDVQFTMFLNGKGSLTHDREDILRGYILDKPNVMTYGVWNDDFIAKFPGRIEARGIKELTDLAFRTRYTLVPPFTKSMPTFVTQKFWKMIYYGIIPIFHPDYDRDRIFDVPDELRVYSSIGMWNLVRQLDEDHHHRQEIIDKLYALLDDRLFNGDFIIDKINEAVDRCTGRRL